MAAPNPDRYRLGSTFRRILPLSAYARSWQEPASVSDPGHPDGAAPPLAGDDEVIRALVRRRDRGNRADGDRIALVVGGGGMRGAYAGGMAHALDDTGLSAGVDVVYGSSAGAHLGAGP